MSRSTNVHGVTADRTTRREWLGAAAALSFGLASSIGRTADESPALAQVRKRASRAGLNALGTSDSEHYVAIGDARKDFREDALGLCEKILASFQKYFKEKGFEVKPPGAKMTVVALGGRNSYARYKGEEVLPEEGGLYEIEDDQLVIFDARGAGGAPRGPQGADPRRLNTFILVHEAIHQLTFDTGMLSRTSDVPVAVSEGLATYGELWQKSKPVIGSFNNLRLQVLRQPGTEWIDLQRLLTSDELFRDPAVLQPAYAESWLLVHLLLKSRPAKFRAYLDLLRTRKDEKHRVEDATKALGDLERLDRELKKTARDVL